MFTNEFLKSMNMLPYMVKSNFQMRLNYSSWDGKNILNYSVRQHNHNDPYMKEATGLLSKWCDNWSRDRTDEGSWVMGSGQGNGFFLRPLRIDIILLLSRFYSSEPISYFWPPDYKKLVLLQATKFLVICYISIGNWYSNPVLMFSNLLHSCRGSPGMLIPQSNWMWVCLT